MIFERHRHRYEVNNLFRDQLVDAGLVVCGTFEQGRLVEIVELPDHPWFVASQFHPGVQVAADAAGAALPRLRRRSARARARARSARRQFPRAEPWPRTARSSRLFLELARCRARPARSARSPTRWCAICAGSGSSRTRTTPAADRLDDGQRLRAPRADGGRDAALPVRAPRHGAARRRARVPSSRTASSGMPAARSSAPTTSPPSSRCSRRCGACSRRTGRMPGIELLFTPMEEVGLIGAAAFDARRGCTRSSATSTTRRRRSARSSSARRGRRRWRCASTAAPRTPACSRRRGVRRSRRRRRRSRICGSGRVDEETTANVGLISGGTARQHRPGVVHVPGGGALARRASSASSCRRCSTRSRSPRRRPTARSRRRCGRATRLPLQARRLTSCGSPPTALTRCGHEPTYALSGGAADANVFNEQRPSLRESRERDDGHPHAGRADHGRRPRARWST